jgi:hypothetical protein
MYRVKAWAKRKLTRSLCSWNAIEFEVLVMVMLLASPIDVWVGEVG